MFAAEDVGPKRITKLLGTRAWPCSSWVRCGTELTVRAAVREVSENWWYGDVFPVEYGKWGDRKPLCFPDVKPFQKIIYVDRGPVQWTDDRWPSEPRVRGSNPLGRAYKVFRDNDLRKLVASLLKGRSEKLSEKCSHFR